MIDYDARLVAALNKVLPTYHEFMLHKGTETPCISYQERNNAEELTGTTLGYSRISYTVKVWSTDLAELKKYACMVDVVLRPLGFKRISTNTLADRNSTMIQHILAYECLAQETY